MMDWITFFRGMDAWLMPVYRLPAVPIWGFFLGNTALALAATILGDLTFGMAVRLDRRQVNRFTGEVVRLNNLSIEAIEAGDREAYRAANRLANEAFGKLFFLQAALSMASLWPVPFALSWVQYRFHEVDFPVYGLTWAFGATGVFILMYILIRILWARFRPRVPFLRNNAAVFSQAWQSAGKLRGWHELWKRSPR